MWRWREFLTADFMITRIKSEKQSASFRTGRLVEKYITSLPPLSFVPRVSFNLSQLVTPAQRTSTLANPSKLLYSPSP